MDELIDITCVGDTYRVYLMPDKRVVRYCINCGWVVVKCARKEGVRMKISILQDVLSELYKRHGDIEVIVAVEDETATEDVFDDFNVHVEELVRFADAEGGGKDSFAAKYRRQYSWETRPRTEENNYVVITRDPNIPKESKCSPKNKYRK
jgi:hypothetical protein